MRKRPQVVGYNQPTLVGKPDINKFLSPEHLRMQGGFLPQQYKRTEVTKPLESPFQTRTLRSQTRTMDSLTRRNLRRTAKARSIGVMNERRAIS